LQATSYTVQLTAVTDDLSDVHLHIVAIKNFILTHR